VLVRNVANAAHINRPLATANPRHTYYLSLSTPGTELRLPALPAIRPGWRLLSATIALAAAFGIFSMLLSPFFQVGPVEISGLQRLTQTDLEAVIDVENLSIVQVDPQQVEADLLERFTSLEGAHVSVSLPTHVALTVEERTPLLAWKQGDTLQWIDAQGVIFQPNGDAGELVVIHSPESIPAVFPESTSAAGDETATDGSEASAKLAKPTEVGPAYLDPTLFATARTLAERLPEGTVLVFTEAQGLGWEDATGYDVYLGNDLSDFNEKFSVVQAIADKLANEGVRPELIDAKNVDAPYYRVEN
jgi:hypothetical protein